MKFSEKALRQHLTHCPDHQTLAETLTAIGLEVEEITPLGQGLDHVVVGKILEAIRHPQADRLQICQVDAGNAGILQIVCGAPNARVGLLAPLALVGATVGTLSIKAAQLRGVDSCGMLCSAKELGLDADASGLLELPADAPVGMALAEYLELPDTSIEIKLTPNRADCFGVRGIAYDVAAASGSTVKPLPDISIPQTSNRTLTIQLNAGTDAPRYCGRVIEGINPTISTPIWMAEFLRRSGVRPVSLLVDITQYIMLELGQPMHAFDLDRLQGEIGVRHSRDGETLTLLDGRNVVLDASLSKNNAPFLLITDNDQPIALAGMMGGMSTRVTDSTQNVFLEAAYFAPSAIMGRSRRLGLHTDASHRFERGVDPELALYAINRATQLILELAGGSAGPVVEAVLPEHLPKAVSISLRYTRVIELLGIYIEKEEIERILIALGMLLTPTAEGWQVLAPSRRFDMAIEEDLIEEIARIYGYNRIPNTLPQGSARALVISETQLELSTVRRQMVARDFFEAITYAFVDNQWLEQWGLSTALVPLANPLSAELAIMRPQLLPGLVAALQRNLARQMPRVRLFEIGKVFHSPAIEGDAPTETQRLAAVICGEAHSEQWGITARKADFYDLKGDIEALAAASGAVLEFRAYKEMTGAWHPGRSADIYRVDLGSQPIYLGRIGQLHPALQQSLGIDTAIIACELDINQLITRQLPQSKEQSKFPSMRRDIAIVVKQSVEWSELAKMVKIAAGEWLQMVEIFDQYMGQGVEPGFKSLAMRLVLQENSRTLTDSDVDAVIQQVLQQLQLHHGAKIRG